MIRLFRFLERLATPLVIAGDLAEGDRIDTALYKLQSRAHDHVAAVDPHPQYHEVFIDEAKAVITFEEISAYPGLYAMKVVAT
jgi:hypothetical protein